MDERKNEKQVNNGNNSTEKQDFSEYPTANREHKDLDLAINKAVDECIGSGILKDLLLKCRAEVIDMVLTSFSMEEYEQTIRDESYHEGVEAGEKIGIRKGIMLAKRGNYLKKQGYSMESIAEELQLSVEEVRELLEE